VRVKIERMTWDRSNVTIQIWGLVWLKIEAPESTEVATASQVSKTGIYVDFRPVFPRA
jgi:hypothetical protein